jgi:hypothetical protein
VSDDDMSPWASLDAIEAEARVPDRLAEYRSAMLNRIPDPVEGRIVGPGEPSPGRNQTPRQPDPDGKQLTLMPLEGRPVPGGTYAAFVLDGPAAGTWRVERDHWRAVQVDHHRDAMWYANPKGYADESLSMKQTVYSLQRLAISTPRRTLGEEPGERRQYWFWSSVPTWEMDPAAAVFLLIDAEPWQTQLCRVPERTVPRY